MQPRFYVIVSIFALLVLVLIALIAWTVVGCIQDNREEKERHNQFLVEEARLQSEYAEMVNQNPEGYADVVRPTISYEDFKAGATLPPVPTPIPTPTPTPRPTPYMVAESNPEHYGFVPHLMVNGEEVTANSFRREEEIVFPAADEYNDASVRGILTFHGDRCVC